MATMLRIMEKAHYKWNTATEVSLRQDGAKLGPFGVFYLLEWVASPFLGALPETRVLEEVISSPGPLENLWDQQGEQ